MKDFNNSNDNIFQSRYNDAQISEIFSDINRYSTWRKLWVSLAENQRKLGLNITSQQVEEMRNNIYNIDFKVVKNIEKDLQHDVMAHLHAFSLVAPSAKSIMHLGVTSEFIKDNTDLILIRDSLKVIKNHLRKLIAQLCDFSLKYKSLATVGFSHFQVAQPTTVGKRSCLWLQSFLIDYKELLFIEKNLKFRSIKGTTGSLSSFKSLFQDEYDDGYEKVKTLEKQISLDFGFNNIFTITGQTYDRKFDTSILNLIAQIASSSHKLTNDIRLLQNIKEIEESFASQQVGSSAMPYKKNPIKSERVSSLSKYLMSLPQSSLFISSTQWLERTLDDSACRRIVIPQSFLTCGYTINLVNEIISSLTVNTKVIEKNINNELPFLATENIMMEAVKMGGDRQIIHEKLRKYSIQTKKDMVEQGKPNDLFTKIINDTMFQLNQENLEEIVNINNFIGYSPYQVEDFITNEVLPVIRTE